MCARRFLIAVLVLTLLAVAAGFALYQWGGNVLLRQATPEGHFEPAAAGGGADYSNTSAWIAHPGLADDPSRWLPRPVAPAGDQPAAVFYLHPTTYLKDDRWNAPFAADFEMLHRDNLFVQSQASAFNDVGEIWAPRYRQAAFGAFLLKSDDARKALDFAYADVARAFDRFLDDVPPSRPLILAGHSQGALHLLRLLAERSDALEGRLIAAYVVGWPVSTTADLPALGLPACGTPDQAGCILSWMSFGDPPNPDLLFDQWATTRGLNGGPRRREDALCVNPISGVRNGSAPARANAGTLIPDSGMTDATLVPGRVGAACSKGLLIVNGELPALAPPPLPGNNFHVYDYALFWGAIRADAKRRTTAWHR